MATGARRVYEQMKADGRMCAGCMRMMDLGYWRGGPRYCDRCLAAKTVILQFRRDDSVWLVTFLDESSKLPIGRQWQLDSAEAVEGLVKRSRTTLGAAPGIMFRRSLASGAGEVRIEITGEQYARIKGK